ncbi:hypothetical protein LMG18090_03947 [Ralstonia mannitolilytica]|nr:hypothetical protein LMG18090_03947 [Ralstonia mannitolilytica]
MPVVRDEDQRAVELGERHGQRFARVEVQVVRRLVEQQQVGALPDDERERQARLFAAGERGDGCSRHVAAEIEAAEKVAQLLLAHVGGQARQVQQRRGVVVQRLELVLGKVADLQAFAAADRARQRRQRIGQRFHERRLALAVGAQQADALAGLDRKRQVLEDGDGLINARAGIAAIHRLERQHRVGRGLRLAEFEREARRRMHGREALHALERLDTALRLLGLGGLGLEARDERFEMRDLLLLPCVGGFLLRHLLQALRLELRVVAAVALELLLLDVQRDVAHGVEEFPVVRDHHQRAGIPREPVFQPDHGIQVEVVRRFVEQQQVGRTHQRLREVQPHAPAAGEARHRLRGLRHREAEAEQQRLRARRRGVAVGVGEGGVGFGLGVAVVRGFGGGQAAFDVAQAGVAVERVVERAAVNCGRFLRHVGDLPGGRDGDFAAVGMQFAAQQRKQRGFAATVHADEADALTRVEGGGGVVEQHLGAALEDEVVESDHEELRFWTIGEGCDCSLPPRTILARRGRPMWCIALPKRAVRPASVRTLST